MNIDSCFKVGIISRAHGLKGEVTVLFDEPLSPAAGDAVFLAFEQGMVPYIIERASVNGRKGYIKFEDINTADEAAILLRKAVYLPKSARPSLPQGAFYDDEVIEFNVVDQREGKIGKVTSIVSAGPNRMLAIESEEKEVLIPLNGPFITSVSRETRTIHVDLPDGFLTI
jgi:16S rRNA processing protein RimM